MSSLVLLSVLDDSFYDEFSSLWYTINDTESMKALQIAPITVNYEPETLSIYFIKIYQV